MWPVPIILKELRSFIGLAAYYRRFIRYFAEIAALLYRLLEKGATFIWTGECNTAFTTLKQKLMSAPVLAYPRTNDGFILDTDASERGIGAVLSQTQDGVERVIAYGSRTLTKTERKYCVTRKKLLALVYFMRHFRCRSSSVPITQHFNGSRDSESQKAKWPGGWNSYKNLISRQSTALENAMPMLTRFPEYHAACRGKTKHRRQS